MKSGTRMPWVVQCQWTIDVRQPRGRRSKGPVPLTLRKWAKPPMVDALGSVPLGTVAPRYPQSSQTVCRVSRVSDRCLSGKPPGRLCLDLSCRVL